MQPANVLVGEGYPHGRVGVLRVVHPGRAVAALAGHMRRALVLTLLVLFECGVLVANKWRCPLTDVASRYTDDRADNFDIYLPRWLARYNKQIFGALFAAGVLVLLWRWLRTG